MSMTAGFASPQEAACPRSVFRRTGNPQTRRWLWRLQARLAWVLVLFLLVGTVLPGLAGATDPDLSDSRVVPQGPLGYDACARLAIQQSPYLTKSSVEIDVRRMDETDSRYAMVPSIAFRSYYYVNRPNQKLGTTPHPYILSFVTEPFNPFGAYFTLQAQKMATQIAVFSHLHIISEGLARLGQMFLNLDAMKQQAVYQGDLVTLARENLAYAENRRRIGTGTSLEVRLASQEYELAKSERERLEDAQKNTLSSLKTFLGLKPDTPVKFDLRDASRQVLGSFTPAAANLEQAKNRSYELKALELKKEVQKYNILLAKTRVLPSFILNAQTPDPLSATSARGLYVGVGIEVPIWDGFKRVRNISRQRAILNQFGNDKDLKDISLTEKWNSLRQDLKSASTALKIARSQEELGRLRERQGEIRYQSGSEPLPVWLEARKAKIEAKKISADRALRYDALVLKLRQLSGDLGYSYVDPKSWQN
jgi:outer membrane protein TolC